MTGIYFQRLRMNFFKENEQNNSILVIPILRRNNNNSIIIFLAKFDFKESLITFYDYTNKLYNNPKISKYFYLIF